MKRIYLMAADRLLLLSAILEHGGLIANVGESDRSASERATDPDYARKSAGGRWNPLHELYVPESVSDHDVHKQLKVHPNVKYTNNPNNTEEFLFITDQGDGVEAKKILEEIIGKLTGKIHVVLPQFEIRQYQQNDISNVVKTLTALQRALLSAFPGWGKSTCAPYIMHLMRDLTRGNLFLFTTPITDSLDGIRNAINTIGYGDCRFFIITADMVDANTESLIYQKMNEGVNVVMLLSVQNLRRSDGGTRKITKDEAITINTELRTRYAFMYNIKIRLWIRDEFHKEYGGEVTKEVFEGIEPEYLLDMTATPYNLIELGEYTKEQIIGDTILNVLMKKREGVEWAQQFPSISIETWEGAPLRGTELGDLYTDEEEWDPRKLCSVKNNQLTHTGIIRALNKRMYGWTRLPSGRYVEVDSKDKNPLSILGDPELSMVAKKVGLHVLAEGDKDNEATVRCKLYVEALNTDFDQKMWYVTAEYIKQESKRRGLPVVSIVNEQQKIALTHGKLGVIIVTHRMLLTGSDIDCLGHIVLFDKINSLNEFMQLNGRDFRVLSGKTHVKLYVACPGMNVSVRVYEAAKAEAHQYGSSNPKEYYDVIPITEYDNNMILRSVNYEDTVHRFNDYQNRILEGDWIGQGFLVRFPELVDLIANIDFDELHGSTGMFVPVTNKTTAKVHKRNIKDIERENKERKIGKDWKETVATMLNESIRIGYSSNSASLWEVFDTKVARYEFGESNIELVHCIFNHEEFYQVVNAKYVSRLTEVRNLGYE